MKIFMHFYSFLLLILFFNTQIFTESKKDDVAYISFILGNASLKPANSNESSKVLKVNDKINTGDLIITEKASKVTVQYKGSEFKIASDTSVLIRELYGKNKNGKVEVNSGLVWFKLVNLKSNRFEVSTPTSTAGVRGTSFATMYDTDLKQAMNCVCEGKVEIKANAKDSKSEILLQGQGSAINLGMKEIAKADYKDEIEKGVNGTPGKSLPLFEKRILKAHLMKGCLSCHLPKDWSLETKKSQEPADTSY